MTRFYGANKSFKDGLKAAPFAIFAGLSFTVPYFVIAIIFGPELTSLVGAFIGLVIVVFAAKKGFLIPKEIWDFPSEKDWEDDWKSKVDLGKAAESNMSLFKAWIPYILIALILVVTRIPDLGLKSLLASQKITISNVMGTGLDYSLKWAYLPGTIPFMLVALLTHFLHGMKADEIKFAWKNTFKQISGAAIALFAGIAMVQLMLNSGTNGAGLESMLTEMAGALARISGNAYVFVSPFIGVLGSFMSGSNTVSNILFSSLQFETATILGMSPVLITAMQVIGGGIGNMVCVNNVVAVCATVGVIGMEGKLIRRNAIPMFIYSIAIAVFFAVLIYSGFDPMQLATL
jgi:lactate permease